MILFVCMFVCSSDLPHHSGNMKTDNMVGNISNIRSNDDRDKEAIH